MVKDNNPTRKDWSPGKSKEFRSIPGRGPSEDPSNKYKTSGTKGFRGVRAENTKETNKHIGTGGVAKSDRRKKRNTSVSLTWGGRFTKQKTFRRHHRVS